MGVFGFLAAVNFISGLSSTIYALWRGGLNKNKFFSAASAAGITIWAGASFLWFRAISEHEALLWLRLSVVGVIIAVSTYVHLVHRITGQGQKRPILVMASYGAFAFFFIINFTPLIISSAPEQVDFFPGRTTGLYALNALCLVLLFFLLYQIRGRLKYAQGFLRLRLKYLQLALILYIIGAAAFFLFLYRMPVFLYPYILLAPAVPLGVYAVITKRFLNVEEFLRRVFVYGSAAATASLIAATAFWAAPGFITTNEFLKYMVLAAVGITTFALCIRVFSYFYTSRLRPGEHTEEDADEDIKRLAYILDLTQLVETGTFVLKKILGVERVAMLIRGGETNNIDASKILGYDPGAPIFNYADNIIIRSLKHNKKILFLEDLFSFINLYGGGLKSDVEQLKRSFEDQNVRLFIPFVVKDELGGAATVGPKMVGDFTDHDLERLELFSRQVSVALENALLYDETKALSAYLQSVNKDLEKKVKDATAALDQRNKELEKANTHLEELSKLKTDFLNMASHQLRTPTTVIRGMMSMIIKNEVDEKTRASFLTSIYESANRLAALINDLLNTAYIEGGGLKLKLEEADAYAFVKKIVEELRQPAEAKKLQLEHRQDQDSLQARFDRKHLHEALYNLIDNAIKYTPGGSVTISLEKTTGRWRCIVSDTGIGIKPEDVGKLFQKFYRTDEAIRVASSGTGLGLYVVKKIIEEHRGTLTAKSEGIGKGTTFVVDMPINPQPQS